eukprot:CAMPEP_0197882282 /NCGR_PEP_ID=MMETSP1439-20131203/9482_1 /TAXON_ID=66791 /ORGANISM="Gonyaulax spinifera, Strain CCMP409" /LENGTH=48 /DNA_ID= /DNA_START= /DNA_END= /DNA_ORIENTATION=
MKPVAEPTLELARPCRPLSLALLFMAGVEGIAAGRLPGRGGGRDGGAG